MKPCTNTRKLFAMLLRTAVAAIASVVMAACGSGQVQTTAHEHVPGTNDQPSQTEAAAPPQQSTEAIHADLAELQQISRVALLTRDEARWGQNLPGSRTPTWIVH